jgi:hypothetical protein
MHLIRIYTVYVKSGDFEAIKIHIVGFWIMKYIFGGLFNDDVNS